MVLKQVMLGLGIAAAVGIGYLAYRYATAPPSSPSMMEVRRASQEHGRAVKSPETFTPEVPAGGF